MKNKWNRMLRFAVHVFLLILLFSVTNISHAAFTLTETFTDAAMYTVATEIDEIKSGVDGRRIDLAAGESVKIKLIIPPGVDAFYKSQMIVSNWAGIGDNMRYGHFIDEDYADPGNYPLVASSAYSAVWVYPDANQSPISTVASQNPRTGYFVIHNQTTGVWFSLTIGISMRIHDMAAYNAWLIPPPTNLTHTKTQTSITLNWDDSPDEAGYYIKENGETIENGTLPQNSTTITIPNLLPSSTHVYQVCVYNALGETCAPEINVRLNGLVPPISMMLFF